MQDFLDNALKKARTFMDGRYGGDQLGVVLVVISLILTALSHWLGRWMSVAALLIVVVALVRIFSKNCDARKKENDAFLLFLKQPNGWIHRQRIKWSNRKTKAYVRCPYCHAEFALPKGKGRLRATCPKCGEKSDHTV